MENDQNQQELIYKLSIFEQQIQQLQQQMQAIEQAIIEMNQLDTGLNELVNSTGKEIIAPVGRGIFVKAKLLSEDLIVDIGGKNLVKKSIPETKQIICEQIEKLKEAEAELSENLENINRELTKTVMSAQEKKEEGEEN